MNLWALKIDSLLIKNAHNISLAVHSRLPTHETNAQNGYEIGKRWRSLPRLKALVVKHFG